MQIDHYYRGILHAGTEKKLQLHDLSFNVSKTMQSIALHFVN